MARRQNRFTIYDAMENAGYFDSNPANADSRDAVTSASLYKGPIQYPKMLYHPLGAERIVVPAEIVVTPLGPQRLGEKREILHQKVNNEAEEQALLAKGWHNHPSKAIRARLISENLDPGSAPIMSSEERALELEAKVRTLQAELADQRALSLAGNKASQIADSDPLADLRQ